MNSDFSIGSIRKNKLETYMYISVHTVYMSFYCRRIYVFKYSVIYKILKLITVFGNVTSLQYSYIQICNNNYHNITYLCIR